MNISSVSALRPSPGTAAYGAAKAGVDSLTRSLAVEWGPKVRVNTVDVGLCRTEQTADHYGGDDTVRRHRGRPSRSAGWPTPTEVGHVVGVPRLRPGVATSPGACVECHGGGEPPAFLHVAGPDEGAQ